MTDVQVAIVPSVWLRQSTGTMVVQIAPHSFKETRLTERGWSFEDFHRGVPTDCVPLMAEVVPENVEEIATHPTEPDSFVRCDNEGPNGQCDQDARTDHWCTRKGNPIIPLESVWSPDGPGPAEDQTTTDQF